MASRYHDGEISVQERAGVREMAARIGRGIHDRIPAGAAAFISDQRFAVIGAMRRDGSVWASIVTGQARFMEAVDSARLSVRASPSPSDPLAELWATPTQVGLLAIDFAERKRMRLNGLSRPAHGGLEITASQVYANCPKYIQAREITAETDPASAKSAPALARSGTLTATAADLVRRSDTFFIASAAPGHGADVSHRGGEPGFVTVKKDGATLVWPDYSGNTMFQTLGNIDSQSHAGLLFVDFATGGLLHISGTARILWDDPSIATTPGAERFVEFRIEQVIERPGALPFRWQLLNRSPYNPV